MDRKPSRTASWETDRTAERSPRPTRPARGSQSGIRLARTPKPRAATLVGLGARSQPAASPTPAANQIKGLVLQAIRRYADEHCRDPFTEALRALDSALADQLRHGAVTAGTWHPIGHMRSALGALQKAGSGGPEVARRAGHAGVLSDLSATGPFHAIGRVRSTRDLVTRAGWLLSRYVKRGKITVRPLESGRACIRFSDCTGFDAATWQYVIGGCDAALAAIADGAHTVSLPRGGRDGDTCCDLIVG